MKPKAQHMLTSLLPGPAWLQNISLLACRGSQTESRVTDTDLGDLTHIVIGHDGHGSSPAWHLDHVVITHVVSGQQWLFPCCQWFDEKHGDGKTERELYPAR